MCRQSPEPIECNRLDFGSHDLLSGYPFAASKEKRLTRFSHRRYFYSGSATKIMPMPKTIHSVLSRRERQIMDILYRRGRATVNEVMAELVGEPNSSTVRTQLRV